MYYNNSLSLALAKTSTLVDGAQLLARISVQSCLAAANCRAVRTGAKNGSRRSKKHKQGEKCTKRCNGEIQEIVFGVGR